MNPVSPNQNENKYRSLVNSLVFPVSAGLGFIPCYKGFVEKTTRQLEKNVTKMSFFEGLKGGAKNAHLIGLTVGLQLVTKDWCESYLMKKQKDQQQVATMTTSLTSAALVGFVSTPLLAIFNGKTMPQPQTAMESLKGLNAKLFGACVVRETTFLLADAIKPWVISPLKKVGGDNLFVNYTSAFVSGVVASVIGHPFDTVFTRLQAKKNVSFKHLPLGMKAKAMAVGRLYFFMSIIKDLATYALNTKKDKN